jgi:hypothetical protein
MAEASVSANHKGKNMIKLALAGLLVAHSMYQIPYTLEIVAATIGLFACIYYYIAFGLFVGLSEAKLLVSKEDLLDSTSSTLVHIVAGVILFYSQYQYVTLFALPWIGLATATLVFSLLIFFGYIEIHESED